MILLGLSGKQRSGKDQVAQLLKEQIVSYEVVIFKLSDAVYEIAEKYFGMKEKNRELLIAIGEGLRKIDKYVFVKYTLKRIYQYLAETVDKRVSKDVMIVVPDIRLPEELELLTKAGFVTVRVNAPLDYRQQRGGYNPEAEIDYTETALDDYEFPYYIDNSGVMDELREQVLEIYADLKGYALGA